MIKKLVFLIILAVVVWWACGFVGALMDARDGMKGPEMKARMEQIKDPIRKSGYRAYAVNFTEEKPSKKALDEVLGE